MREIEFRGKRVEEPIKIQHYAPEGWVYGGLIECDDGSFILPYDISGEMYIDRPYKFRANDVEARVMLTKVDVESVGQYTGFKDQNGKKIFDGDIFEIEENEAIGVVVFEKGAYRIEIYGYREVLYEYGYDTGSWDYLTTEDFDMYYIDQMEVIGNIYDNPELLKGE